jgi:hypothetical protein
MKQILIVFALVISSVASADTIKLFETRYDSSTEYSPEFQINKSLGRAWVNVAEAEYMGDSSYYRDNRVLVPGLSYDASERTIVFEKNGERIVCAELYNRRFVIDRGNSVRMTERCSFSQKKVTLPVDNGFEIRNVKMVQVFLNIE